MASAGMAAGGVVAETANARPEASWGSIASRALSHIEQRLSVSM